MTSSSVGEDERYVLSGDLLWRGVRHTSDTRLLPRGSVLMDRALRSGTIDDLREGPGALLELAVVVARDGLFELLEERLDGRRIADVLCALGKCPTIALFQLRDVRQRKPLFERTGPVSYQLMPIASWASKGALLASPDPSRS